MFKEISKINFSEFENIIKNPSQFLQQYDLSLSNNEIYFIVSLILLFIIGVFFELFKSKKEKLIDKYNKLLKESYELSNVSRKDSDAKLAEANKILEEIEAIG